METATVYRVYDGDSVRVTLADGTRITLRLDQIDAPELHQFYGSVAHKALMKLLPKKATVEFERVTTDRYGRTIARVYRKVVNVSGSTEEWDINLRMVALGHAWAYKQYVRDSYFSQLQNNAKTAKLGLWKYKRPPTPPWVWRHKMRLTELGTPR